MSISAFTVEVSYVYLPSLSVDKDVSRHIPPLVAVRHQHGG